nr:hypothetical protein BaRGS_024354 [Batillaria attramentaria]
MDNSSFPQPSTFIGLPLSEGVRVTVLTLGWLACVSGVFGNVLIIFTLLSQQALRSLHNMYIANLALADLLVVGVRLTVLTLGWLACVNGIFGNVLIITTLLSQRALRSLHSIFIANLALADLLVVGYVIVFWLLDLSLGYNPVVNDAHCNVNSFVLMPVNPEILETEQKQDRTMDSESETGAENEGENLVI